MVINKIIYGFFIFLILIIYSCGFNYYYVEGGPRPKKNNFKVSKLSNENPGCIEKNAIYFDSKMKWGYKFYSENKLSYFKIRDNKEIKREELNPLNGKMGYFECKENKITTYIFIKKDSPTFHKEEGKIIGDTLFFNNEFYIKNIIPKHLAIWKPDW